MTQISECYQEILSAYDSLLIEHSSTLLHEVDKYNEIKSLLDVQLKDVKESILTDRVKSALNTSSVTPSSDGGGGGGGGSGVAVTESDAPSSSPAMYTTKTSGGLQSAASDVSVRNPTKYKLARSDMLQVVLTAVLDVCVFVALQINYILTLLSSHAFDTFDTFERSSKSDRNIISDNLFSNHKKNIQREMFNEMIPSISVCIACWLAYSCLKLIVTFLFYIYRYYSSKVGGSK